MCMCFVWKGNSDGCHLSKLWSLDVWQSLRINCKAALNTLSYFWKWNSFRLRFPDVRIESSGKCTSYMRWPMFHTSGSDVNFNVNTFIGMSQLRNY